MLPAATSTSSNQPTSSRFIGLCFASALLVGVFPIFAVGQATRNPNYGLMPNAVPLVNVGGGPSDSQFFAMDFAQKVLENQNRAGQKERERQQKLVATGTLSPLDLAAPNKALNEFNQGSALLRGPHSQEAIEHLQKAVAIYPKFVSAHNYLGLAYQDADDPDRAKQEFETAASLDPKFGASFVNLARLSLSRNDYSAAESYIQKATALRPDDAAAYTVLAYAQQGNREYSDAIQTVNRIHGMSHDKMGSAHYVAAVSAVTLNDYSTAQSEFALFLKEDPNNPLAATAQYNIGILDKYQQSASAHQSGQEAAPTTVVQPPKDLANSDRLKSLLAEAADEPGGGACTNCGQTKMVAEATPPPGSVPDTAWTGGGSAQFTIRKVVDEVAVFFGVSSGGHPVSGLTLTNISVTDDNRPPEKLLQFSPQSKLPLRLGLLIDTSGSVQSRFGFEKTAATRFIQQMLANSADLGFVGGFADTTTITQDFTNDHALLAKGIAQLTNDGGTTLFDAVSYACFKLSAYPEHDRVAKVLVVLSDGEENSSHNSLRQTIREIEETGVTVYTISTKEGRGITSDADKILQSIAERSGGEAFFPGDIQTLSSSFDRLRDEIRSRYLIAYRPADFEPNGKYRTITIAAQKDGKTFKVHARKGYHARVESSAP